MDKFYAASLASRYGNHFFDGGTMRFFNSRILDRTWTLFDRERTADNDRVLREVWRFLTSEKFDHNSPRMYTIREMTVNHDSRTVSIETIGEFQGFTHPRTAYRHIRD